jgi:hypothetical protein
MPFPLGSVETAFCRDAAPGQICASLNESSTYREGLMHAERFADHRSG